MKNRPITFEELCLVFENETPYDNFKVAADFLLEAVTDWPSEDLFEPIEIISELRIEMAQAITYDSLNSYLKNLSPIKDHWKIHSISALLKLFDFSRNRIYNMSLDLEEIIEQITFHYRDQLTINS